MISYNDTSFANKMIVSHEGLVLTVNTTLSEVQT